MTTHEARSDPKATDQDLRLRALLEKSFDGIALMNPDAIVEYVSPSVERILGYTPDELVGVDGLAHTHPDDVESLRRRFEEIFRQPGASLAESVRLRHKDGSWRWVEGEVTNLLEDQTIRAVVANFRDVTDRKRLEREAQTARADAVAANRMKDEFLAILSHEIRTPLSAIVGWATILSTGLAGPEEIQDGLAVIERNAEAQAQILEDLLDISRIISGGLHLDVQRVNVVEVIEAAIAAVTPTAEAKGVQLKKVLDPLAGPVFGAPTRLQQVVSNLLSNAVKFTPNGGHVQILLERVNSHVEISVIDTGVGIRPDFLPSVFDRFRQADSSSTRRHGGLGLGLAIVKQLTELHGGSVRAKSAGEGQGSTFVVSLPITAVQDKQPPPVTFSPAAPQAQELDCSEKPLSGIKVLVVDDESDARQLIRRVLEDTAAEVAVAASADEAAKLVESFRPDILISDIGMPDQDGYDLIRHVRGRQAAKTLPAVAMTAFARPEDRKRVLLAGFQTHVAKPVDPAELVAVVASLVERTGRQL